MWVFTKTSAYRNIGIELVYLLRMQMYSTCTRISKEKKHKCCFQFCRGLGAAQAYAQFSLRQKHPVGPISSEVLCKIMFITRQPMVAGHSSVALVQSNCLCQASVPTQMAAACWGCVECNTNWPCQCETALFHWLSYCFLTCFGTHQVQDVFCCCCCTELKHDFCLLQTEAGKCCFGGKQHSGLLNKIKVSMNICFTLYILTKMTASNSYGILQGQILVYTREIK